MERRSADADTGPLESSETVAVRADCPVCYITVCVVGFVPCLTAVVSAIGSRSGRIAAGDSGVVMFGA